MDVEARAFRTGDKPRVLVFAGGFQIGGSERQAVALVRQLVDSEIDVQVACFHAGGPLAEELPQQVFPVHAFPLRTFYHPSTFARVATFIQLVRRRRIQIVQCFDFYANLFAIPLARLAGVPIILGSRRDSAAMRTRAQRLAENWCFRLATGVIANTPRLKRQLICEGGLSTENVWVIQNGVDLDRFSDIEISRSETGRGNSAGLTVAVLANLRPEKGHFVFLEAVLRLKDSHPDTNYVIAGDGPLQRALAADIERLGLIDRVQLVGEVRDVPAFLRATDIVVLPSTANEGAANSLIEAMAAGRPVVCTMAGGTPDVVNDGLTGILVEPSNPTALAEGIGRLCDDHRLRQWMGEQGRARASMAFAVDRMGEDFVELYRNLLSRYYCR